MGENLGPPKRAIGISRQEGHGVSEISFPPQEHAEGRALGSNHGPSFGVVADAFTTSEPGLSRRRAVAFFDGWVAQDSPQPIIIRCGGGQNRMLPH